MTNHPIIIFDGICNFCNGAVNFIIKRDPEGLFVFTPMQSEIAKKLIVKYEAPEVGYDTFLLIKNNTCYYRTDAAFEITKNLSGFWYLLQSVQNFPKGGERLFLSIICSKQICYIRENCNVHGANR